MAINDSIISLLSDVVRGLRNTGTIISETYANNVLTLELTSLYDLAVNKYIEVGGENYKIIAIDSGASTVGIITTGVTGETTYTVPTPYFWNGTMQMINKQLQGDNDPLAKYPAVLVVDVFQTERITDPTSAYFAEPRVFIAFLKEADSDYGSDLQNPIINEMQDLSEDFITALQAYPYVGRFDSFTVTRHANFGVYASDRGHISTIIDHELSGVVLEITIPILENYENCTGNVLTAIKCAPVLIKDEDGNLIETKQAGSTYVTTSGGDVEIYDTDSNLLYTVTAPDSQTIQNSQNRIYLNSVILFPSSSAIETVAILAEGTETTIITVENSAATKIGSNNGAGNVVIADSTIENSNGSYSQTLPAEDALVLPNIDFTDSDGTTTSVPSMEDLVCSPQKNSSSLYKTGQTTSYATNDDGDLEQGRGVSFNVLETNNPYGNTTRLLDELGGTSFVKNIYIDWSTADYVNELVLGWYGVELGGGGVDWSTALSATPYSYDSVNWYIPNVTQANSIINYEATNFSHIGIISTNTYWTSTTVPVATTTCIFFGRGFIGNVSKVSTRNYIVCRIYTFTELGL